MKKINLSILGKMSRSEATKWKECISDIVNNAILHISPKIEIKHKIAGSYSRKQEEIGDIDYIIVVNDNESLYQILINVLDQLTEVRNIGELPVKLDSVIETPSKLNKNNKIYSTAIKMWFKVGTLKTKIEIYGYSNCEFCFPYFARSAEVNLQKKVKMQAIKLGYKLSPYGLFIKDTNDEVDSDTVLEKIGKQKITTIKNLFDFLEYSSCNN